MNVATVTFPPATKPSEQADPCGEHRKTPGLRDEGRPIKGKRCGGYARAGYASHLAVRRWANASLQLSMGWKSGVSL